MYVTFSSGVSITAVPNVFLLYVDKSLCFGYALESGSETLSFLQSSQ